MYCAQCGAYAEDGSRFCSNCGAPLQAPGGVAYQPSQPYQSPSPDMVEAQMPKPARHSNARGSASGNKKPQDPFQLQIKQLRLQLRQLKLDLKQLNTQIANIHTVSREESPFVPHGLLKMGFRAVEDVRLMKPQQQKQVLQQEIMQLEQQLLSLEQQQQQWKQQQEG